MGGCPGSTDMVASQYGQNEERKCRPTLDWTIYNTCFKGNSGVMSHQTVGSWLPIVGRGGGGAGGEGWGGVGGGGRTPI